MKKALYLEIQKIKFSKEIAIAFIFICAFFLINSFFFWQDFQQKYWRWAGLSNTEDPWVFFIYYTASNLEIIAGISTLSFILWQNYIEHNNHTWQRLLVVPIERNSIIYAKLLISYMFGLIVLFVFLDLTLLILKPLIVYRYNAIFSQKKYHENSLVYFKWMGYYAIVFTKFVAFHFWLTLKCREKYLLAFSIGFIGIMLKFITESPYGIRFDVSFSTNEWVKTIIGSIVLTLAFIYFSKKEILKFFL